MVDDNAVVRKSIAKRLVREAFLVQTFESGEKVLDALHHEHPDAVLLDFKMPGLNGEETLAEMRKRGLTVPVVILTAYSDVMDVSKSQYQGVVSLVTKSLELEDVVSVAKEAITNRRSLTF
ncbi:response regulator [Candidatus Nitronereus thalassa]|uniref:Response regulator n=1 Tax=Candidatus Nitronereus thalassa TaxID=3020898 RepID=A0ABU3KA30_9BACT|nr:response regulator [Candidatus Nitronereus thalassa]MDT7043217.1 response regulator [Candidatus Nitronereus thalassa]